jgi:hypothetical protein
METGTIRDEQGRFIPGVSGNPNGRTPDSLEDKIVKKATKELIAEYKEALGESLPMIQPILIAKALEGDMVAIKEIHDRVMDKSKQSTDITTNGESVNPVLIKFIDADNRDTSGVQETV